MYAYASEDANAPSKKIPAIIGKNRPLNKNHFQQTTFNYTGASSLDPKTI